jgi:glutamine phosphoribosylpyrophosphate amidotransferase
MCAVIGAVIKDPSLKDFEALKRVFIESKIRGMHATGISFLPRWTDEIVTIKEAIPADQFVEKHMHKDNFKEFVNADGNLYMIGHCRYSTSDLEYNQPISDKSLSVAHNGVITQELPERWKELYGYDCETKNDSELLLHTIQEDVSPLERWKDASLSVCVLSRNKTLQVFRNGKRPLYLTTLPNGVIITSTADIPNRAGLYLPTMEAPVNTYITFDDKVTMMLKAVYIKDSIDYQNYENSSD